MILSPCTVPSRRLPYLVPLFIGAIAGLLCAMVYRVYPYVVLNLDVESYIESATSDPQWLAIRTPVYGSLLWVGIALGFPNLILLLQTSVFCMTLMLTTWVAGCLLGSPFRGGMVGALLILFELGSMQILPPHFYAMSDMLFGDGIVCGYLCLSMAILQRSHRWLVSACVILGLVVWMRPVVIPLFLAMPVIVLFFVRHTREKKAHHSLQYRSLFLTLSVVVVILFGPIMYRSLSQYVRYGSLRLTPILGLDAMSYITELYEPGDRVFPDPMQNALLERAIAHGERIADDPLGLPMGPSNWTAIRGLFQTLTNETGVRRFFAIDSMSRSAFYRLIILHPRRYASMVIDRTGDTLTRTWDEYRFYWRSNPLETYSATFAILPIPDQIYRLFYGPTLRPDLSIIDLRTYRFLESLRWLSESSQVSNEMHYIIFLCLLSTACYGGYLLWQRRSQQEEALGVLLLVCTLSTIFLDLAMSMVWAYHDPRFGLPGILSSRIALALTFVMLLDAFFRHTRPTMYDHS